MFTSNPWTDYLMIVSSLIAGYYVVVALRFYGRDMKALVTEKRGPTRDISFTDHEDFDTPDLPEASFRNEQTETDYDQDISDELDDEDVPAWQSEELFDQVEDLAAHLKTAIEEAHEKAYGKQDLVLLLQMTLKDYPTVIGTPFQLAINNLIEAECAKYGSIHLRGEDKVAIWKQVA